MDTVYSVLILLNPVIIAVFMLMSVTHVTVAIIHVLKIMITIKLCSRYGPDAVIQLHDRFVVVKL